MNNFTYDEMLDLLKFTEQESKLFIPNEIFLQLKEHIFNSSHIAFSYAYIYLITWLYRYTKYYGLTDTVDQKLIKAILGVNQSYKGIDYLIKKNGILQQLGYIDTITDYPISWSYDKYEGLEFETIKDYKNTDMYDYIKKHNSYRIKYPIKAFYRDKEDDYYSGTFYEIDNTHLIPFEVFTYCMCNDNIGYIGFYIYSFLKFKNQIYNEGYDTSIEKLIIDTGIKDSTLKKYLHNLKSYNLISFIINQEYFVLGLNLEERQANTYITNNHEEFTDTPIAYQKIKVLKRSEHKKIIQAQIQKENESKLYKTINLDELPY